MFVELKVKGNLAQLKSKYVVCSKKGLLVVLTEERNFDRRGTKMNGIKLMCLGILCVLIALYLNYSGIVRGQNEIYLVFAGVILGVTGLFKKDT